MVKEFMRDKILLVALLLVMLVFKNLFLPGTAVWGDAPYFYSEVLKEYVSEPTAWTYLGNSFGGVNKLIFLWPFMFLYGFLHTVLGVNNDVLIRMVFYFPSLLCGFFGMYFFTRYLRFSSIAQFFSIFLYLINTYFILLIDGGQVGIALAYGIFPLTLLALKKLSDQPSVHRFYLTVISLVFLMAADPRVWLISVLTIFTWSAFGLRGQKLIKSWLFLLFSFIASLGVGMYWIYPLMMQEDAVKNISVYNLQLTSLLHTLTLYQPHWPANEFGKITYPPFYFLLVPVFALIGLFLSKGRALAHYFLLALFFAFLAKGTTPPFGEVYGWVIDNIPFGAAFRDSTKFYMPLILFYSIAMGISIERLFALKKVAQIKYYLFPVITFYFLFLISPTFLSQLNGTLHERGFDKEINQVNTIMESGEFYRSVWFPEKHPLAYQSKNNPAINASDLADFRPFATLNIGTYDRFNFLHDEFSSQLFKALGIKYLTLSGDFRKTSLNEDDLGSRQDLESLMTGLPYLTKLSTEIPLYEVEGALPDLYTTNRLIAVVGSEDIYQKILQENKKFDLSNQGFLFFEDGKWEPRNLQGVASESAVLVLNDKREEDLALSFLQKFFIGPQDSLKSEWAIRGPDEYLKWKYELLVNGVDTHEFDYNHGIAFSTQPKELLKYDLQVSQNGKYILAVRSLGKEQGAFLGTSFNGENFEIPQVYPGKFSWDIREVELSSGIKRLSIENNSPLSAVNIVALIPKSEWDKAWEVSRQFTGHFSVLTDASLGELPESKWTPVETERTGTLKYTALVPGSSWLVFTDAYHPLWTLKQGHDFNQSLPFYSMVNGFYTQRGGKVTLLFQGQEDVRWGLLLSTVSVLSLAIYFLWNKGKG